MKKLTNNPESIVIEAMAGLASAHPDLLKVHYDPNYIMRLDASISGKVALVSGGGSGHEPLHTGYVGKGMLDAACPGEVFTPPTSDQIEAAAKAVDGGAGILFIVKNFTGDVTNFEKAAELLRANGIETASVITNDDVAVENSVYTVGRRGLGITVFAEKITGAAAERGMSRQQLAGICRNVNERGRSMGMALTSCTMPTGKQTFQINEDEMEIGIGIRGEPGRTRMKMKTAREITALIAESVISDLSLKSGDAIIAMVNGMGGTPLMELYVIYNELANLCRARGIQIVRWLVGNYITSLEMSGCSITLMKTDETLTSLWDDPVLTPALRWGT